MSEASKGRGGTLFKRALICHKAFLAPTLAPMLLIFGRFEYFVNLIKSRAEGCSIPVFKRKGPEKKFCVVEDADLEIFDKNVKEKCSNSYF